MNTENSSRFLNAFIGIEDRLGEISGITRHKPFYQLVNAAARKDPFVHDIEVELKEYADLRNAIVHERVNDQPIAEPHPQVVERIEKIQQLLRTPPTVADQFLGPVITAHVDESVAAAAERMYQHGFSKMPVYANDQAFRGLLTAETIVHWIGHKPGSADALTADVGRVLAELGSDENYKFSCRNCTVFEVLRLFDTYSHEGRRLQAVIITEDGGTDKEPLGIITVYELPQIYRIFENH